MGTQTATQDQTKQVNLFFINLFFLELKTYTRAFSRGQKLKAKRVKLMLGYR